MLFFPFGDVVHFVHPFLQLSFFFGLFVSIGVDRFFRLFSAAKFSFFFFMTRFEDCPLTTDAAAAVTTGAAASATVVTTGAVAAGAAAVVSFAATAMASQEATAMLLVLGTLLLLLLRSTAPISPGDGSSPSAAEFNFWSERQRESLSASA